jgi:micrococcal nuclease
VKRAAVAFTLIALTASGCRQDQQPRPANEGTTGSVPVTRVVDGDTIHVLLGGRIERLRLIGVDAPEIDHPEQPAECYGKESARFAQRSLDGRTIRIEFDVERRDRFDRLLAYVFMEGELFNETLVAEGFAIERSYPPNLAHQEELRKAEIEARQERRGLWRACER